MHSKSAPMPATALFQITGNKGGAAKNNNSKASKLSLNQNIVNIRGN
jgi:hypothetical protein